MNDELLELMSDDDWIIENEDCDHGGIECEPDECVCRCGECSDLRMDAENEIEGT